MRQPRDLPGSPTDSYGRVRAVAAFDARADPERDALISRVAANLKPRQADITSELHRRLTGDIPELRGDERILELLNSSIESNVAAVLDVLQHQISLNDVQTPLAAVEYTRRLAQHGVPTNALLRAYRLGHERFFEYCLDELGRQTVANDVLFSATARLTRLVFGYIDRISEQVVAVYEAERLLWLQNRAAVRAAAIRSVLTGELEGGPAVERTLGYRLGQWHLGLVLWVTDQSAQTEDLVRFDKLARRFAQEVGCEESPLFVPRDEVTAWTWLPLGSRKSLPPDAFQLLVAGRDRPPRVAVGEPGYGIDGLRATHRQALRAQSVALISPTMEEPVIRFAEVGALAMMSADLDAARAWVQWVLGPLASQDDQNARLRETLRVFLAEGASYKATAARLMLHKNTVQYRLRKAVDLRGRGWDDDRVDLELALLACRWFGAAVLAQTTGRTRS